MVKLRSSAGSGNRQARYVSRPSRLKATAGSLFCLTVGVAAIISNILRATFVSDHFALRNSDCGGGNENRPISTYFNQPIPHTNGLPLVVNTTEAPPRLLHCGGMALNRNFHPVLFSILPEYQWIDLSSQYGLVDQTQSSKATLDSFRESSTYDLFVSNWRLDECKSEEFYQWLHLYFQGRIVFLNPEDATLVHHLQIRPNFFELGPGISRPNRKVFYFMQAAFWAQMKNEDKVDFISNSRVTVTKLTRHDVDKKKFLIYAHSHCVGMRQKAFRQIANMEGLTDVAYYGGRCNGGMKPKNDGDKNQSAAKAQKYPNKVRLKNWEDNRKIYREFRFCLTMEHVSAPGYITEKILLAYWAGCIPIYYGTTEIYNIFHSNSFIYYDIDNPRPALDRIKYLEQNRTAYLEALQHPILTDGEKTVEDYFSFDENMGRGILKGRIRSFLGVDKYRFT